MVTKYKTTAYKVIILFLFWGLFIRVNILYLILKEQASLDNKMEFEML
jgi:hypothetical protein